ncbi:cell division protein FtsA [Treponema sp.]|uniref:cell division protein FtsA n=1 Tax=Treponema sp. TaxID=166 RepID=UPI00298E7A7E|nr:cell division protein FtsA [Treponema sp.]
MTDIIVGLDIGTSNIRVAIGEVIDENTVEIMGLAKKPSSGIRNGTVINIEAAIEAIKDTIEAAEQNAGYEVFSCVTAIGGSQIESYNSHGLAAVSNKNQANREINQQDKDRALESARATLIPLDREFLHVVPRDYTVDGVSGIKDPIHMIGVRLETDVHIVTASKTAIQNVCACVNRAGYNLDKVWLKTLAQVQSVVHEDEIEMGSILIDLGAGTTDVLVLNEGAPVCSLSIPVGGNLVTNDISIVKGIPLQVAERIKLDAGCCFLPSLQTIREVTIPGVGGRAPELVPQDEICQIIQPRMEEIFALVRSEIVHKTDLQRLSGNIILTGGGALMPGVVELAQNVFGTTAVRLGVPESLGGIDENYRTPEYATVIGLVQAQMNQIKVPEKVSKKASTNGNKESILKKILKQLF